MIEEYLKEFEKAELGRDVKKGLLDCIRQCYEDATGNPESVAAVVKENKTLKEKLQSAIDDLGARISNIIANATTTDGNSELIDIRLDGNGTKHTTAGDAVRAQYAACFKGNPTIITADNYEALLPDMDGVATNSVYTISGNPRIANAPSGVYLSGALLTFTPANGADTHAGIIQMFYNTQGLLYMRLKWGSGDVWKDWVYVNDKTYCVSGVPTSITADNYEALLPDMNNAAVNRIRTIAGAPVANHPQDTTAAGGTLIPLSSYSETGKDGEVQMFFGRYGELYTRRIWSGAYSPWHMESGWGRLAGKNLYCDGDSIAAGYERGTDNWQMPYGEQIAEKYSMVLTNAAVGGTTLAVRPARTDSICERTQANLASTKPEFILLDGGINDVFKGVPMGQMVVSDEIWSEVYDTSTTIGALETLCKFLIKNQPKAKKIFVLTHAALGALSVQDTYFEEMRKVLKKWGIEYVDIRCKAGMIPLTDAIKEQFFYKKEDGTLDDYHPTKKAYAELYVPPIEDMMVSMAP